MDSQANALVPKTSWHLEVMGDCGEERPLMGLTIISRQLQRLLVPVHKVVVACLCPAAAAGLHRRIWQHLCSRCRKLYQAAVAH